MGSSIEYPQAVVVEKKGNLFYINTVWLKTKESYLDKGLDKTVFFSALKY